MRKEEEGKKNGKSVCRAKRDATLTSPWQFRPIGVFSGKKYKRRLANKHCSFLSRQTIRSSAMHAIGESDHGRTGMQSPSANTNGFL